MRTHRFAPVPFVPAVAAIALLGAGAAACSATSHELRPGSLGALSSSQTMEALLERPGPIEVETIDAADWQVTRAGLINLDHPAAKKAGLTDGDEPISVFVHVVRHPTRGTFLIDSGISRTVATDPAAAGIGPVIRHFMHVEKLAVRADTAALQARLGTPIAGVFFTHLHLDHVMGVRDLPPGTPLYAGPGEDERAFMHLFSQGSVDGLLDGHAPIATWPFAADPSGRFAGVLDVFGDGSLFALWVPGHSGGSTAYVARTPQGPVLMTGERPTRAGDGTTTSSRGRSRPTGRSAPPTCTRCARWPRGTRRCRCAWATSVDPRRATQTRLCSRAPCPPRRRSPLHRR